MNKMEKTQISGAEADFRLIFGVLSQNHYF
jgi:hypothetical protein